MHRASRVPTVAAFTLAAIVGLQACRRKPTPEAAPVAEPAPAPTETCDAACRAAKAREDSLARARDAAEREAAAKRAAIEAARAAITATIYFDYDRSDITDESRTKLDAKVPVLTQNPGMRIRIAGHTDSRGSDEYNLALGQRRAAAAKRYLTDRGVDGTRIEVVSFGEERATCGDEAESCWSQNRRDEFEITAGGDNITVQTSSSSR